MSKQLSISVGQHSSKGRKALNQDFNGVMVPDEPLLSSKGIAIALADGISSSEVSQIASETAVKTFFDDYYSTSEAWSVKTSAMRVLQAANSWLYSQNRNGPYRYDLDKGYVCTFSTLVLKSATAHIFHAGDARIYRLIDNHLELLTEDHRVWISREKSYLGRALGMKDRLEVDYQTLAIEAGDTFVLATDGVYEFADEAFVAQAIDQHNGDLDCAAQLIVEEAYEKGSADNLTIQIVRVDRLPEHDLSELHQQAAALPFPPELRPRMSFDGYQIIRELHHSHRSHVFLAVDDESKRSVAIKVPSVELRDDEAYLERFLMEEWVARRIDSAHVLKPCEQNRKRSYLYIVTEYIEGKTLNQWMADNPNPDLESVRDIVGQIAVGLRALHRQEMLHQDLRPNNIMIDATGTVKLIDFGSVRVAGVAEIGNPLAEEHILGTAQYTAPEYFLGEPGTTRSDLFSLAVIAYQMLSGRLPYGAQVARATSRAAQQKLVYQSVLDDERTIPLWVDGSLRKAVHPNPNNRYDVISEFLHDLRNPNPALMSGQRPPLMERNPLMFWKGLALVQFVMIVTLLVTRYAGTH